MDPRAYVDKETAKKLRAAGKVEGRDFVIPKHCLGQTHHLCIVCLRLIRRRDQRCKP